MFHWGFSTNNATLICSERREKMGFDWQSDAWRDGYDEWKTRAPDWYDDGPEEESEREYRRLTPKRHFLKDEIERRSWVNHARNAAVELRRANEFLRGIMIYPANKNAENLKRFARRGIAEARRQRTLIGPVCPTEMLPF
jgi:hypothetical protein